MALRRVEVRLPVSPAPRTLAALISLSGEILSCPRP